MQMEALSAFFILINVMVLCIGNRSKKSIRLRYLLNTFDITFSHNSGNAFGHCLWAQV